MRQVRYIVLGICQVLLLLAGHAWGEACPKDGVARLSFGEDGPNILDVSESTVVDPNGYTATILAAYPLKNGYLCVISYVLTPLLSK